MTPTNVLGEGCRVGRFVIMRDIEGRWHAVATTSVSAICEDDGDAIVMLPGGRIIRVGRGLQEVLAWLECGIGR